MHIIRHLFILALLGFIPGFANPVFIEKLQEGQFVHSKGSLLQSSIPKSEGMQKAYDGYTRAQVIANRIANRKRSQNHSTIQFLGNQFQPKPLYITLDDGDWAYNEIHGRDFSLLDQTGRNHRVTKAPLIRLGRNMPGLNDSRYLGEIVAHETGHAVMNALYSGSDMPLCKGGSHHHDSIKDPEFALVEGFAEYYAKVTYGDRHMPRSYNDRNPQQLNSSEGYIASVLVQLDQAIGQDALYNLFAEFKPKTPAQVLEAALSRHRDKGLQILEAMQVHSGDRWPPDDFIKKFQEGTLTSLDLDGDGKAFGNEQTNSDRLKEQEALALKVMEAQTALDNQKYLESQILNRLNRLKLVYDVLTGYFSHSSWRSRMIEQVKAGQNNTLEQYEQIHSKTEQYILQLKLANEEYQYYTDTGSSGEPSQEGSSDTLILPITGDGGYRVEEHQGF